MAYLNESSSTARMPAACGSDRISGAALAFPRREDPRHHRVLRLGAHLRRWAAGPSIIATRGRWRDWSPSGPAKWKRRFAPLRDLLRRRAGHHGGGQSRRQDAGGKTIGLNIGLPFEQRPNPFITPELTFEFHYFFMRKFWFAYLAKALVVFPGGFGTLDEMIEILTLAQTQKLERRS